MKRFLNSTILSVLLFCILAGSAMAGGCETSAYVAQKMTTFGPIKDYKNNYQEWYVDRTWNVLTLPGRVKSAQTFSGVRELCNGEKAIRIFDQETRKLLATYDSTGFHQSQQLHFLQP